MLNDKLFTHYNLGKVIEIKKDIVGTGNNYFIKTENEQYFVKIFENNDTTNNPYLEVYTNNILRKRNIPVTEFIQNKKNAFITTFENKVAHIQKFITGKFYNNNLVPEHILLKSSRLLGQIHSALEEYTPKKDFSFIKKVTDIQKSLIIHETLLETIKNADFSQKQHIQDDLEYKICLLKRYSQIDLYNFFCQLTHNLSHGDYNCRQLIINNDEISAIIDFSRIGVIPVVWEITRSYTIGCSSCSYGNIDLSDFQKYLAEYQRYFKLSDIDLNYMWEFYKVQLLGSSYGYREYIYDGNNKLLNFAFWRTNLIHSLESDKNLKRLVK